MNLPKRLLLALISFCFAQAACAQTSVTVRDFRKQPFNYGYEGWEDLGTVQKKTGNGVQLTGPAKGGAGAVFAEIVDVVESSQLEVKIKRGAENTETSLMLKFIAADNKSHSWNIPLKDVSDKEFTVIKLDLASAKGKVNLEEIKQMQIQGTFNPEKKVDIEIQSVVGTKAPAQ